MKASHTIRSLLIISLLSLSLFAHADAGIEQQITELRQQINERQQKDRATQQAIELAEKQISEQQQVQEEINTQLRRFHMDKRRINVLSDQDNSENQQALGQLEFEIRRAQFNLQRAEQTTAELDNERRELRRQGRIIRGQLSILEEQLAELEQTQQQQQLATSQQQAAQQARATQTAENNRLAAKAEAEAEQQRIARQQAPAQTHKTETGLAPNRVANTALELQIQDAIPSDNYASFNPNESVQQQVRRQLIGSINRLPPAQSALTMAMAIALESSGTQAVLGHNPDLHLANPIDREPMPLGKMQHLGNNQYLLEVRLRQGLQKFVIGDYSFTRRIPEHFDNIRCLLLLDLRNKEKPVFQLVVAGG